MSLLEVTDLTKSFRRDGGGFARRRTTSNAVEGVSFRVEPGEVFALVGESGAGKSTTGRMILRLIEPDAGSVTFEGQEILGLSRAEFAPLRRGMQMIFQDSHGSLDPRYTIIQSVAEPLWIHFRMPKEERFARAADLMAKVGLGRHLFHRRPSALSGGQLQRVSIARALTLNPRLIVCDEPVAALDASIRAQVLNLMNDLQQELGIAYVFVSHDLSLIEAIAHRVAVMRGGRIVEQGPTAAIFDSPSHEYTRELLSAIPVPVPRALR